LQVVKTTYPRICLFRLAILSFVVPSYYVKHFCVHATLLLLTKIPEISRHVVASQRYKFAAGK